MKILLANVVYVLHLALTFFVLFGWLSWTSPLLFSHVVLIPLLLYHWRTNEGTCFLSNVEARLRGQVFEKAENHNAFTKTLLRLCMKRIPADHIIDVWVYSLVTILWLVSFYRYFEMVGGFSFR